MLEAVAGEYKDSSFIRKVEEFNPDYRLREKGAVLNWFDITEVDGYFSLNDKLSDIVQCPEGAAFFKGMAAQMMKGLGNTQVDSEQMGGMMMQMMGSFTVLRLTSLMGAANIKFSKEQLLGINAQLNKIKKP